MSVFKILMPKLGESVQVATIINWFVKEGDEIEEDGMLFGIATEKVDSEIPSPVKGTVTKIFFQVDDVVPVGEVVALIDTSEDSNSDQLNHDTESTGNISASTVNNTVAEPEMHAPPVAKGGRFYSPLVRSIAKDEGIPVEVLETIEGSGIGGRLQKQDILAYINSTKFGSHDFPPEQNITTNSLSEPILTKTTAKQPVSIGPNDQIIEMDRVRKLIAEHMVHSVSVAPHVTTVVEADVSNLVLWRSRVKEEFKQKYGDHLTYMPVFIEAAARALREFPYVNSSVDGDKIILRKKVNIGIAVAKPDGNLIVPVIADADQKNIMGLSLALNDLANRARTNKLVPDEIQGGTFTITNFGSFRNLIGTPIINQPQVAILATGSIEKKPAVMETPTGDAIVVRHKMFLSLSYDHRVIDGATGGAFLRRIADILESFDMNKNI